MLDVYAFNFERVVSLKEENEIWDASSIHQIHNNVVAQANFVAYLLNSSSWERRWADLRKKHLFVK